MQLERSRTKLACLVEATLVRDRADVGDPDSQSIGVIRRSRECRDRHRLCGWIVGESICAENLGGMRPVVCPTHDRERIWLRSGRAAGAPDAKRARRPVALDARRKDLVREEIQL